MRHGCTWLLVACVLPGWHVQGCEVGAQGGVVGRVGLEGVGMAAAPVGVGVAAVEVVVQVWV